MTKKPSLVQRLKQCEGCRRRRERLERMIRRAREASRQIAERATGRREESRQ